jgi:hypothetical protein
MFILILLIAIIMFFFKSMITFLNLLNTINSIIYKSKASFLKTKCYLLVQ